jgi:hypothetical protein
LCGTLSRKTRLASSSHATSDLSGTYRLKTQSRGSGECLEGNQSTSAPIGGAAFMNACKDVSSQVWKVEDAGSGWYWLKTQFSGGEECLEGNETDSPLYRGAAFMDTCRNVTGQLWKFVLEGNAYRLKTQFRGEGDAWRVTKQHRQCTKAKRLWILAKTYPDSYGYLKSWAVLATT